MKKTVSRTIVIVLASLLAAVLITVLVLCLVHAKPMTETFGGYQRVEVCDFNKGLADRITVDGTTADYNAKVQNGLKEAQYSMMQALLEGKCGDSLSFKAGDDNGRVALDAEELSRLQADDGRYMLLFYYDEPRTIKVKGEELIFDRAALFVDNSANEIRNLEAVFYLDKRLGNEATADDLASDTYSVYSVLIRADSTALYNAVAEIVNSRK